MMKIPNNLRLFSRPGSLRRRMQSESLVALLFILPSLVGLIVFVFIPAARGFYLSFTNSDLLTRADFIGLENYQRLFADAQFWSSLAITLKYVLFNIPVQTMIALALATAMSRLSKSNFLRGIVLLPYLLPIVMVTLVWLTILDYEFGPVNGLLHLLGLTKIGFFGQDTIIPSPAWINTWRPGRSTPKRPSARFPAGLFPSNPTFCGTSYHPKSSFLDVGNISEQG